ncbi:MAG TPA: hypothetical protein G4N93_01070 [Dehalococcoidia bacterium]|nr:hypothetical protein [Dehalococcoidia bacterium]
MRWTARVIESIAAVFFVGMLIASAVSEGIEPITTESSTLVLLRALAAASCIASWWRDITAGTLLVLTSIGLGIHIGYFAGYNHVVAWSIIGLPYLVAGIIILSSWRLSRRAL